MVEQACRAFGEKLLASRFLRTRARRILVMRVFPIAVAAFIVTDYALRYDKWPPILSFLPAW